MNIRELQEKDPCKFDDEYQKWVCNGFDYDWYDYVFDMAKEDGAERGFDIRDIFFTGFCSQGDGASWEGVVDVPKFLDYHLKLEHPSFARYNIMKWLLMDDNVDRIRVGTSGRYCHSSAMHIDDGIYVVVMDVGDEVLNGPFAGAPAQELYEEAGGDATTDEIEKWILDEARSFADDIYKNLQEEYEYLTSEESFIEWCEANDVEFEDEEVTNQ